MKLVQCWDDGVSDDIRLIEILRRHGAKASFNLNFGTHPENRTSGWKFREVKDVWKLAKSELLSVYEGFTIANHSSTHPHLNQIPLAEAKQNISEGRDALEQFFGKAVTGFAYPFGSYNEQVEEFVRESGHVYARTTKNVADVFPPENAMAFHANCHFLSPDFWAKFEHVKSTDGVFYFWGHSYELITEDDWAAFDQKIARMSAENGVQWFDLPSLFEAP